MKLFDDYGAADWARAIYKGEDGPWHVGQAQKKLDGEKPLYVHEVYLMASAHPLDVEDTIKRVSERRRAFLAAERVRAKSKVLTPVKRRRSVKREVSDG